jgi:CRP/FNR family transcriptional regulator, cyclic AMP receptor protein
MAEHQSSGPGVASRRHLARQMLKTRSCFSTCPDDVIDSIMDRASSIKLTKGNVLYRQGEPGESLMVVLEGRLKVVKTTADAKEVVLAFLGAGDIIGEMAVLDGHPRSAGVVAMEPVEGVNIYRRDLIHILKRHPDALLGLLAAVCRRLRTTISLIETYSLQTESRVAAALFRLAQSHGRTSGKELIIEARVTQSDLGNHLGLTRETVSRTLGDLRSMGLLKLQGQKIVIVDVDGLKLLAGGHADPE